MTYALGVDLGTAYTCAAVARPDRVDVVQLGAQSNLIPSVVSVRPDGTVLTGEAAERRAVSDPSRTVREFKRRFGDDAPFVIGGTPYGAETLMGHLLAGVLAEVTKVEGEPPAQVALTHPADYGAFKLDLLREAARLAGIDHPLLVAEPVAAAIAYASRERVAEGQHLLVYDLGGGTFDAAVVRMDPDGPMVVGTPEGLARLGGIDFDQAVIAHVEGATGGAVTALDSTDPDARAALARLRADCRAAKEALSDDTETEIPVLLPQLRTSVRLTREELESMVAPRLTDTARMLERVVQSAGLAMTDIATVLLVGGSSRMPVVAQLVREHTGRPVAVDTNPKTTVAAGAAALAGRIGGDAAVTRPSAVGAGAVPTVPIPAATPAPDTVPTPVVAPTPAEVPPPSPPGERSRRPLVLAAVALVAIVGAAVAFTALSGGDDETATDDTSVDDTSSDDGEDTTTSEGGSGSGSDFDDIPDGWLDGEVLRRVEQAISAFDTGITVLAYDSAANYADGGGVTAGRAYFSTARCDALEVINVYTEAVPDNDFAPFMDELNRLCEEGSDDTTGLPEEDYTFTWINTADEDESFRDAQDQVIYDTYFAPAMEVSDELGLELPLSRFAVYDTAWQQTGPGRGDLDGIIDRTIESVGDPGAGEVDEVTWLYEFLLIRRDTLEDPGEGYEFRSNFIHRVDCLESLADEELYDLDEPISCPGYGSEFTTD